MLAEPSFMVVTVTQLLPDWHCRVTVAPLAAGLTVPDSVAVAPFLMDDADSVAVIDRAGSL